MKKMPPPMPDPADKLRVALVGCGKMGAQPSSRIEAVLPPGWLPLSHAESITSLPDLASDGRVASSLGFASGPVAGGVYLRTPGGALEAPCPR